MNFNFKEGAKEEKVMNFNFKKGGVRKRHRLQTGIALLSSAIGFGLTGAAQAAVTCDANNTVTADVVVLDQALVFNRLGAQNVNSMIYTLRGDVVDKATGLPEVAGGGLELR